MALFAFVGYSALRSNRHFAFDRCSTHDTPMPRYLAKVVGNGVMQTHAVVPQRKRLWFPVQPASELRLRAVVV